MMWGGGMERPCLGAKRSSLWKWACAVTGSRQVIVAGGDIGHLTLGVVGRNI